MASDTFIRIVEDKDVADAYFKELGGFLLEGAAGYCITNDTWYRDYCLQHGRARLLASTEVI